MEKPHDSTPNIVSMSVAKYINTAGLYIALKNLQQ